MKIVHLARDEKFVPLMQQLFGAALPGCNHWLIARRGGSRQRHVAAAPEVTFRPEWWLRMPLVAADVRAADVIVAHSMTTMFANAIRQAPRARVVWIGWGYDYYPLLAPLLGDPILPATRALMAGRPCDDDAPAPASSSPAAGWAAAWSAWRTGGRSKPMALSLIAPRIHTCCVIPTEVALLRQALPALTAVPHELPLFTAEDTFGQGGDSMGGPDVLLGNSATASNNHAEALTLLQGRLGDGKLVLPLSYGQAAYGDLVAARARAMFGEHVDALQQWMSLADYNHRTAHCGFVVMNHRRQQAVGNIGAALFRGATVYLRRENPLFAFYTGLGITLRAVDQLADGTDPLQPITPAERSQNRSCIAGHYARDKVLQAIRTLPALQG